MSDTKKPYITPAKPGETSSAAAKVQSLTPKPDAPAPEATPEKPAEA